MWHYRNRYTLHILYVTLRNLGRRRNIKLESKMLQQSRTVTTGCKWYTQTSKTRSWAGSTISRVLRSCSYLDNIVISLIIFRLQTNIIFILKTDLTFHENSGTRFHHTPSPSSSANPASLPASHSACRGYFGAHHRFTVFQGLWYTWIPCRDLMFMF